MADTKSNRIGFHADESFVGDDGQYVVVEIVENEPGYRRTPFTNSELAVCVNAATTMNIGNGLTKDDMLDIRTSSIAAGKVQR